MNIRPQNEFPLLDQYAKKFKIDKNTIFAYSDTIYTNNPLPDDILVHEKRHLKQMKEVGLDIWVERYLNSNFDRLLFEVDAYQAQLRSIKNRELRNKVRIESAKNLSSSLYGNIIEFNRAFELLKV